MMRRRIAFVAVALAILTAAVAVPIVAFVQLGTT
jgi:hypothetical protein